MRVVYSAPVLALVVNIQNVLEINGIGSSIRNQFLSAAAGEIPPNECWPQLLVAEEDFERASKIIEPDQSSLALNDPWTCLKCGEENEGQFAVCWNCGAQNE